MSSRCYWGRLRFMYIKCKFSNIWVGFVYSLSYIHFEIFENGYVLNNFLKNTFWNFKDYFLKVKSNVKMQESKCLIHPLLQIYTNTYKTFQIITWMWTHNLRKRYLVQAKNGSFWVFHVSFWHLNFIPYDLPKIFHLSLI
jgi:hypothetical protein